MDKWNHSELMRCSVVVSILNLGKPFDQLDFYRPICSTCVGKLIEKLANCTFSWLLDHLAVLPTEISGSSSQPCTTDANMKLTSSFEETRARHHTAHIAFLDFHRAIDTLPHEAVINQPH